MNSAVDALETKSRSRVKDPYFGLAGPPTPAPAEMSQMVEFVPDASGYSRRRVDNVWVRTHPHQGASTGRSGASNHGGRHGAGHRVRDGSGPPSPKRTRMDGVTTPSTTPSDFSLCSLSSGGSGHWMCSLQPHEHINPKVLLFSGFLFVLFLLFLMLRSWIGV